MKTSFSVTRKKTPFAKHKEDEEAKKKRADAEAAKLYEEFVVSFQAEDEGGLKTFVRGEVVEPGSRPSDAKSSKGGKYVPSFVPPGMAEAMAAKSSRKDDPKAMFLPPPSKPDKGKPRAIDMVLEEMKRDQEERARRGGDSAHGGGGGGRDGRDAPHDDGGDPYSTNLYVGNLAQETTEDTLKREFVRFGPIASVKIMWPRTDEERSRGRNCGFVAFMDRIAAAEAKEEMDGRLINGHELRTGWGKSVPLPQQPIWPPPGGDVSAMPGALPPPPQTAADRATAAAMEIARRTGFVNAPESQLPTVVPRVVDPALLALQRLPATGADVVVALPDEARTQHIIDCTAKYVLQDGCKLEQYIMEREQGIPEFAFLFQPQTPEHTYYRWRLFSLANGDELLRWRTEPFQMIAGGPRWVPPGRDALQLAQRRSQEQGRLAASLAEAAAAAGPRRGADADVGFSGGGGALGGLAAGAATVTLTDVQADQLEELLRGVTMERRDVRAVMGFALDHALAAADVVEMLVESLTLAETPFPTKVARLYVVSDVLHNSSASVRNASAYRTLLEAALPTVFESLRSALRGDGVGRIAAEQLKRRVLGVLRVWENWFLFPEAYLTGLQATFLRPDGPPANHPEQEAELEGLTEAVLDRRCRRAGICTSGGRAAMVTRLLALHEFTLAQRAANPSTTPPASAAAAAAAAAAKPSRGSKPSAVIGHVPGVTTKSEKAVNPEALTGLLGGYGSGSDNEEDGTAAGGDGGASARAKAKATVAATVSSTAAALAKAKAAVAAARSSAAKGGSSAPRSRWTEEEEVGVVAMVEEEGEALAEVGLAPAATEPVVGGRWASDDAGDIPAVALATVGSGSETEEERQKKRKIELAVLEYRTALEDGGRYSRSEIDTRVAEFRHKQQSFEAPRQSSDRAAPEILFKKDASRDGRGDRERERERGGRKRSRSRSRSRSPGRRSSRGDADRDRDRERARDRDRERERERERNRTRR